MSRSAPSRLLHTGTHIRSAFPLALTFPYLLLCRRKRRRRKRRKETLLISKIFCHYYFQRQKAGRHRQKQAGAQCTANYLFMQSCLCLGAGRQDPNSERKKERKRERKATQQQQQQCSRHWQISNSREHWLCCTTSTTSVLTNFSISDLCLVGAFWLPPPSTPSLAFFLSSFPPSFFFLPSNHRNTRELN